MANDPPPLIGRPFVRALPVGDGLPSLDRALGNLGIRAGIAFPTAIGGVFRALITLDGTLRTLAPGFDTATESEAIARQFAVGQMAPQSLRDAATAELLTLLPMLRKLPRVPTRSARPSPRDVSPPTCGCSAMPATCRWSPAWSTGPCSASPDPRSD
jgi:hypothetical protein